MGEDGSYLRTEELYTVHLPILNKSVEREKLINVINSCISLKQLTVAEKYKYLWENKYKESDEEINRIFFSKKMKLKNGWYSKN